MRIYSWIGLSLVFTLQSVASDYGNWSDGSTYVQSGPTIENFIYEKINTRKINNLPKMENAGLHVYAFNAGQSNTICLTKKEKSVMIDGGADKTSPLMEGDLITVLKNYLDKNPLQHVFITHPHKDHYNLFITKFSPQKKRKNDGSSVNVVMNKLRIDLSNVEFTVGGDKKDWEKMASIN